MAILCLTESFICLLVPEQMLYLPQLKAFFQCNVHIIIPQVDLPGNIFQTSGAIKYELENFQFPTTRQIHYFQVTGNWNETIQASQPYEFELQCGIFSVALLHSKSNFKMRLPPFLRQNCIVQVYIEPPICPTWKGFPQTRVKYYHIFGTTMFDTVVDSQLGWSALMQQATTWRWFFVHCTKLTTNLRISKKEDLVSIFRGGLRQIFDNLPVLPVTLVFGISDANLGTSIISETYVVTEIGGIQDSLQRIKLKYKTNHKYDAKSGFVLQLLDMFSIYKWHKFDFEWQTTLKELENFQLNVNQIIFFHHNAQPLTSDKESIYITNWNAEEHYYIYTVVLSLLFLPNMTFHNASEALETVSPELASRVWQIMFDNKPAVSIMPNKFGESLLTFRDRDELHFVTCVPRGVAGFSLKELVSPFDGTTWLLLLASLVLMTSFSRNICKSRCNNWWESCVPFIKVLLRQKFEDNDFRQKTLLYCWLVTGIIFCNLYEGENICRLAAPLAPLKVERFEEIIGDNFTVYSSVAYTRKRYTQKELLANYKTHTFMGIYDWLGSEKGRDLKRKLLNLMWTPSSEDECLKTITDSFFDPMVGRCKSSAFVSEYCAASEIHARLQKRLVDESDLHKKYLTISREPLERSFWKICFTHFPVPPKFLSIAINRLVESGLPKFWITWDFRIRDLWYKIELAKHSTEQPEKISLKSNLCVLFILQFALLFGIIPIFIFEVVLLTGRRPIAKFVNLVLQNL